MNAAAIFGTIQKGMQIISALVAAKKEIEPAIKVVFDLATGAMTKDVTDEQLAAAEAQLDAMIDEFNKPME